ncbi:MAG TPA: glucose-6-phosphate dehydrogenase [Dissulfurispiraceae bacterium]
MSSVTALPEYKAFGACEVKIAKPCCLVIFGASGDLTKRKLMPSLYHLHKDRLLPEEFFAVGVARTRMSDDQFRDSMKEAVRNELPRDFGHAAWSEFAGRLYYSPLDYAEPESYGKSLGERLPVLEKKHRTEGNRIFYLAIPPTAFEPVIRSLHKAGMSREDRGYVHVVVEKPFGRDLESAMKLNAALHSCFKEEQIFRIDHYLAKETVQSILMLRFANSLFEPVWNRRYVDHVQITAAETVGVEHRAGYYEEAGVIRDMFQNHMLQLLALTAMEPPVAFEADRVRDEKIKLFRATKPLPLDRLGEYIVTGQYGGGEINGVSVPGYREEEGVSKGSVNPTFAAMKLFVDNWRWNGVPFYLRSGKRLAQRKTEITIHFKKVPHLMFAKDIAEPIAPDILVLRVQPDEGISLVFQTKRPGSRICLEPARMDFSYKSDIQLDAYEWVLLECMLGDHMLFLRQDGVEETWALLTPAIERLEATAKADEFPNYAAGSSGPCEAILLMERDGRAWRPL